MSGNRAPKSGFAAEAQRKVCTFFSFFWFCLIYDDESDFIVLYTHHNTIFS